MRPAVRRISVSFHFKPEQYVVSGPITNQDLGQVCFEIPLEEITGPSVNISADYRFTTYERRFDPNPDSVGPYDTTSDLFRKYTASQPNIELSPEIATLAESIIGDEQNPYRKSKTDI